jgi:hypothetical protein
MFARLDDGSQRLRPRTVDHAAHSWRLTHDEARPNIVAGIAERVTP